ncbi:MAG: transglycosylase SLT domain-containing protein [Bacillota bacterium]|nr:transglycosylase SLT domain-containing protein [Bacillota bacterium]
MKILLSAGLLVLLTLGLGHGNVSAQTVLSSKCLQYGEIKPNENPSFQQINCLLTNAALDANIPPEVVKAVATQENSWRQFNANGEPIISNDGGIGLMQITNQPNYDQEKLKTDLYYNIETGVKILSNMYDRTATDLPHIKGAGRDVIENWYFPVMAYNGTKPVNSPLYQQTGERNTNAYQEKVFSNIEQGSFLHDMGTVLAQFPFSTSDFQYDSNSDNNIVFLKKEYIFSGKTHKSAYSFQKGNMVAVTQNDVRLRSKPSASSTIVKHLAKNTDLIINGNFTYDQSSTSQNQFVWYPVMTNDKKFVGYIPSAYITASTATSCLPYSINQKIYWNGVELRSGQIGRLTVLQNTALYKVNGTKKTFVRTLKKGEFYRIYALKPGMLSVGGGYYVDRNTKVKYETPSKVILDAVKCIASFK